MDTKFILKSKEVWMIILGLVNAVLNSYGFPSFEPTKEFYSFLLGIIAILRIWFTNSGLSFKVK